MLQSYVAGMHFPQALSNHQTFARQAGYSWWERIKFNHKVNLGFRAANARLKETLERGACFYGPFKGEFGHFTAHTLPFLMYLHQQGVRIHYCGMDLHRPLLVDEKGESIVETAVWLRDFFGEVPPVSNSTVPPADVIQQMQQFYSRAQATDLPLWDIADDFFYWFVHRQWLLKGHTHTYDLSKFYKSRYEKSCVIFPRSKGARESHNHGLAWDYTKVIDRLLPWYDHIYVCGHPAQVLHLEARPKVELRITADNASILEACSNANLILTQHSGVNNLGEFTNTPVLLLYRGGEGPEDIGSLNNTLWFRQGLQEQYPLSYAFDLDQLEAFVIQHTKVPRG
ncbi:MAG: hypothetical protein ACFB10_11325 [Salibacteraceae bacterium]